MENKPCKQLAKVLLALCEKVGSPVAYKVSCFVQRGEWIELQKLTVSPRLYRNPERYWEDAMCVDFLRKAEIDGAEDLEAKAIKEFYALETWNAKTNVRLARYLPDRQYGELDVTVLRLIGDMRKEVKRILGAPPLWLTPRFSGGATVSDPKRRSTIPDKMSSQASYYPATSCLLPFYWESAWGRVSLERGPKVVRHNVFFTVPKNSGQRRGCAKEASIPVALQLDVGRLWKARLLENCGIDLKEGQDAHQRLACYGSLTGRVATIDMSTASDTTARVVPMLVVPTTWMGVLDSLRATHTRVDGKLVRLEKFSSMGNGFTFELETVIFTALARTIANWRGFDPERVSCYGDDLIVPTEIAQDVIAGLRLIGYKPNTKKTFLEGPFRESCGGDYHTGTRVNTCKLEELPDEPQKWISLANNLRRVAKPCPTRSALVHKAWRLCLDALPKAVRDLRGPESLGDCVIHDDDSTRWKVRETGVREQAISVPLVGPQWESNKCVRGRRVIVEGSSTRVFQVRALVPVPQMLKWKLWAPAVQLASCTLGLMSNGVTPRGELLGYEFTWIRLPFGGSAETWLPSPHP